MPGLREAEILLISPSLWSDQASQHHGVCVPAALYLIKALRHMSRMLEIQIHRRESVNCFLVVTRCACIEKYIVYARFSPIRGSRHPLGALEHVPCG